MRKLKYAVIGLGSIADHHVRSIKEIPNCELVAVCSSNAERAKAGGAKYGVSFYTDFRQMFQQEEIDLVSICTISGHHLEPTIAAAEAGVHVIVEKPLEVSLERAEQMIDICRKAKVKLSCIFQNRYADDFQRMKKAIDDGLLGKIVLANAYIKWFRTDEYYSSRNWRGTKWGDGGAALMNQSIHTIDLLQHIMGEVESIYGKIKTTTHDIEGEDLGVAILNFKNGALATIEGTTSAWPGYAAQLSVYGENGSIVLEGGKVTVWNIMGESGEEKEEEKKEDDFEAGTGASDPMAIDYFLHKTQIEKMVRAILYDEPIPVGYEEGLKSLKIIQGIYESSEKGKEIYL